MTAGAFFILKFYVVVLVLQSPAMYSPTPQNYGKHDWPAQKMAFVWSSRDMPMQEPRELLQSSNVSQWIFFVSHEKSENPYANS
jgi:hypothetical protein